MESIYFIAFSFYVLSLLFRTWYHVWFSIVQLEYPSETALHGYDETMLPLYGDWICFLKTMTVVLEMKS
jgi:hypothetical protein